MSKDTFDRVTAIASRQPALNPARHHVSPAVLEFRLLQMTQERDQLVQALYDLAVYVAHDLGIVLEECIGGEVGRACKLLSQINAKLIPPTRSRP